MHPDAASTSSHPFAGRSVALLTCHGKAAWITPALAPLGLTLSVVDHLDTDALGSFTRDIPRAGSQRDAARRKAELALEHSDADFGLGSEGAFPADPWLGMSAWNIELLLLVDRQGREWHGLAESGEATAAQRWCKSWPEVERFAGKVGFPAQALVLADAEPGPKRPPTVFEKAITDAERLRSLAEGVLAAQGRVWIETEQRAHLNPLRQRVIAAAAADLAARLASLCPACGAPGFGRTGAVPGRPCSGCGLPTELPRAWRLGCVDCGHTAEQPIAEWAEPGQCNWCNP